MIQKYLYIRSRLSYIYNELREKQTVEIYCIMLLF